MLVFIAVSSTYSNAVPALFTFTYWSAVNVPGVSVSETKEVFACGLSTNSNAVPPAFTFTNLSAVKVAGVSVNPVNFICNSCTYF